jgi:hypothetical protein
MIPLQAAMRRPGHFPMTITNPSPETPLGPEQEERLLKIYALYRERISQEDNLINHRMSWLLWSQAIFFAFWVGLANGKFAAIGDAFGPKGILWADLVIAGIGMTFAGSSRLSIKAAQEEIEYLKDICYGRHSDLKDAAERRQIPSLVGHKDRHKYGHVTPTYSPFFFHGSLDCADRVRNRRARPVGAVLSPGSVIWQMNPMRDANTTALYAGTSPNGVDRGQCPTMPL